MSIWFFVWLALSIALLYFMGWTMFILLRQKTAWKNYAVKKKLRYNPRQPFTSADINGVVYGYTINIFTSEHAAADGRSTRKLTAIEVHLTSRMPFDLCAASGGMVDVAHLLGFKEEIPVEHGEWEKAWIASATNHAAAESYLTSERLAALTSLMKIKGAWVIAIFRKNTALLRLDTPDPLDSEQKIDKLLRKMTEVAGALELKAGEEKLLKSVAPKQGPRSKVIEASKNVDVAETGLSLEEDPPSHLVDPPETPPEPQAGD